MAHGQPQKQNSQLSDYVRFLILDALSGMETTFNLPKLLYTVVYICFSDIGLYFLLILE